MQLFVVNELADEKDDAQKENKLNNAKNKLPREIELVILKNRNGKAFDRMLFDFHPKPNTFFEKKYTDLQLDLIGTVSNE